MKEESEKISKEFETISELESEICDRGTKK